MQRLSKLFPNLILLSVLILTAYGCSLPKYARIDAENRAKYDLGKSPKILVTQAESGRRNYQDQVVDQLIAQSRRSGYATVVNKLSEGIRFDLKNGVITGSAQPAANEYFLKFELLDNSIEDTQEQRVVDLLGLKKENVDIVVSKFGISFTLAGKDVVIEQKEIDGKGKWDKDRKPKERNEMLEAAVGDAVTQFLAMVTPAKTSSMVRLDDSEEVLHPAVKAAANNEYKAALQLFLKHLETNPNSAAALYNTAVMYDAMASYDEALAYYEKAEKVQMNSMYSESKAACVARKSNRR